MKQYVLNNKNRNRINALKLTSLALIVSSLVACGGGEGIVDSSATSESSSQSSASNAQVPAVQPKVYFVNIATVNITSQSQYKPPALQIGHAQELHAT